ncbi:MAG TPA: hypothetical protein VJ729_06910 [Nitrososphaeraceae archaeon]|nr:hypothetical protein [Nitrososphaeraceae archaeon]
MEVANILKEVIGMIVKACTKNKVALVCTGDANTTARGNDKPHGVEMKRGSLFF